METLFAADGRRPVTTHREIVGAISRAAADGDSVVLATVVRVTGSSYGGVGARTVIRTDGSTVGLVSGGCLESDLAEHARRVHANGRPEVVRMRPICIPSLRRKFVTT